MLLQCAFVPAGSIYVVNFELPGGKGRGRGREFSETVSQLVIFVQSGVCAEPWTPVAARLTFLLST